MHSTQAGSAGTDLAQESLASTGKLRMRATGASMLPALWPGDELYFERCEGGLAHGDIVLYCRDARLFVHRIVRLDAGRVITQGDALASADPAISPADVLGKLQAIRRRGKVRAPSPHSLFRQLGRALLRRSDFATRMALRWHRANSPTPA